MYYRPTPVMQGDPGLFGAIGKAIGGVVRTVAGVATSVVPGGGIVRAVAGTVIGAVTAPRRAAPTVAGVSAMPYGAGLPFLPNFATGAGGRRGRGRRMNAGNAKAARRAIRRIKAVRHMLQQIERQLPHKKCAAAPRRPFARRGR